MRGKFKDIYATFYANLLGMIGGLLKLTKVEREAQIFFFKKKV